MSPPSIRKKICDGSYGMGTGCGECENCLDGAARVVRRLSRIRFNDLTEAERAKLSASAQLVVRFRGLEGLQHEAKDSDVIKMSCPRCASTRIARHEAATGAAGYPGDAEAHRFQTGPRAYCGACGWSGPSSALERLVVGEEP